jgi:hypothetical protein
MLYTPPATKPKILTRHYFSDGSHVIRVGNLHCDWCAAPLPPADFWPSEPWEVLCAKCQKESTAETYGDRRSQPSPPRPVRYVAGEALPGQSSGKLRKSMCYGGAENANGLWDNLVRAMEGE